MNNRTPNSVKPRMMERHQLAERLLRAGEYTIPELAKALGVSVSPTRVMINGMLGRDRDTRRIYISGWDVVRGVVRLRRVARFRWRQHTEMDAPMPSLAACRERLEAEARASAPPPSIFADPLLGAMFRRP